MLGLQRIGYIWTDLQTDNTKRIIQSRVEYPLTGKEIISMAKMQNRSPSFCKQAGDGILGSKFVSILITGLIMVYIGSIFLKLKYFRYCTRRDFSFCLSSF